MSFIDIDEDENKFEDYLKTCNANELGGMLINSARIGHVKRIEALLRNGADVNYGGGAAMTHAAGQGHLDVAELLVRRGLKIEACRDEALGDAVAGNRPELVRYLLKMKADPRRNDSAPLWTAVVNGRAEIAELLLEAGADANANKGTLLCIALSKHQEGIAQSLLAHGADPRKYFRDMNAYEWAAQEGMAQFSKTLRDWESTDVYMSAGFFKRQTVAELRGVYDERQKQTGFYLAATAGCFDVVRDRILETPGEKLTPGDLLKKAPGGASVLSALGASGQLSTAFDPRLWAGRKDEAMKLYTENVPAAWQAQVDIQSVMSEIDRMALKTHAVKPGLKLKPRTPKP